MFVLKICELFVEMVPLLVWEVPMYPVAKSRSFHGKHYKKIKSAKWYERMKTTEREGTEPKLKKKKEGKMEKRNRTEKQGTEYSF